MTDHESTDVALTLPGLELDTLHGLPPTFVRTAVEATLAELQASGLLEPRHAGLAALALTMADAVTYATAGHKGAAAAMAARELRETLTALPAPAELGAQEKFDAWVDKLERAANAGQG